MKRLSVAVVLVLALIPAGVAGEEAGPKILQSKIRKVTVYADRAQVAREAKVKLPREPTEFAFKKLPGWVDDGSVRVTLSRPDAGRIVDVRVQREYLARATDEEYVKAETAVREIADQIALLDDELIVLDAKARQIQEIRVFSMEKVARDAPLKEIKVETYGKVVDFVADSLRQTSKERREIALKRRALAPELAARQRRLLELRGLTQLEQTTVLVTLAGKDTATVKLTYMLPGATWEPAHELRALGANPDSAEITSFAVVTQTSGEDWDGAEIVFSTQSSTESNRIPELTALKLGDGGAAARIVQEKAASFHRAQAAFEGQNRMWNKMNVQADGAFPIQMEVYENNLGNMQMVQSKAAAIFQRLRKRGTTAHFPGIGRATIRGDGHSVRVPIGKATLPAAQAIVAVPEQSLNAVKTLDMLNEASQPLLPGSLALFQDGAFLGMTDIDFVAQGETFAVFLGVADQVKLSRMLDRKHSSIHRKKRTRMKVRWEITVENLAEVPVTLDLADRIPVSENKEIEVDEVEITGDKKPDSKGLLRWTLTLKPKEKKTFRIQYRIEYPPALVRRMQMEVKQKRSAMPARAEAYNFDDVSEQIMDLEDSF